MSEHATAEGASRETVHSLAAQIAGMPAGEGRLLVAVVGAPASGKSLLAEALARAVTERGRSARAIPMDGFHLDNRILEMRGLRHRKGAPETFDADGFVALMRRMKSGGEVVYPLFDRARDLAVAGAGVIEADCDIAIVEGNYLLFDEAPWNGLQQLWDFSVWLDVPERVLLDRLIERWLRYDHTPDEARARAEGNDIPNCRRIIGSRLAAHMTVTG